jgi:hypothetical protein
LYVNLRGFDPSGLPTPADTAIRGFLDALGVDPATLPVDPDAQAAQYRGLVAGRRMLIVLDNAATADQVTALLPGAATCTAIVTSRTTLTSLITRYGARHVALTVLDVPEAHALLTQRLGNARPAAESDAAADLVRLCGRYPLALTLIAARAHAHPRVPLADFVTELRESGVHALDDADPAASLPAVLSWSLTHLTAEQRATFALLGAAPGPDISLPAVANLAALPRQRTRAVLRALAEASLLERDAGDRYAMHELIRDYAATTGHPDLTGDARTAALRRLLDFYAHTAHLANQLLDPHQPPVRVAPAEPATGPDPLPDAAAAMSWFTAEHRNLLAGLHTAAGRDWHDTVWRLAWSLSTFTSGGAGSATNSPCGGPVWRPPTTCPTPSPASSPTGCSAAPVSRWAARRRHSHIWTGLSPWPKTTATPPNRPTPSNNSPGPGHGRRTTDAP